MSQFSCRGGGVRADSILRVRPVAPKAQRVGDMIWGTREFDFLWVSIEGVRVTAVVAAVTRATVSVVVKSSQARAMVIAAVSLAVAVALVIAGASAAAAVTV